MLRDICKWLTNKPVDLCSFRKKNEIYILKIEDIFVVPKIIVEAHAIKHGIITLVYVHISQTIINVCTYLNSKVHITLSKLKRKYEMNVWYNKYNHKPHILEYNFLFL